jgi:methionyl-tRNA formyltransferase
MKDLRVDLAEFQGPLDLLLYLVQQEEVDIYEISIARIADRFLEICRDQVNDLDVDNAGEFLVMASQLLVMKSRALLPRDDPVDLEEIDPRLDLVRQLLEYRRFKGVSTELAERFEEQRGKAPVRLRKPAVQREEDEELELDLYGLVSAFQRLLRETGEHEAVHMPKERLPITHFVGHIFDELTKVGGRTGFKALVGQSPDRTYVIGAFLALLELIKLRKVRVIQDGLGEIQIEIREDAVHPSDTAGDDAAAHVIDEPELADEAPGGPRVVFMGSPEFAVPALRSLVGAGFAPRLVVTPPPRRAGRGRRLLPVPVAREAEKMELPLHRTNDVNGRTSRDEIEAARPEVVITAGFGQKLGPAILGMPERGCLNVHASLLPKYRGASPVAAAIRDGLQEIGVSLFVMDEALDEGPVIAQRSVKLEGNETVDEATALLAEAGADLLVRTLGPYLAGEIEPQPQDDEAATYVSRLRKKDGVIDWDQPAEAVRNQIRSVTTWPGAQTAWQPKVKHDPFPLLVLESGVCGRAPAAPGEEGPPPGTVLAVGDEGIEVACGEGALLVTRVRPSGGRAMAVKDFLNARRVVAGDRFVAPRAEAASRRR